MLNYAYFIEFYGERSAVLYSITFARAPCPSTWVVNPAASAAMSAQISAIPGPRNDLSFIIETEGLTELLFTFLLLTSSHLQSSQSLQNLKTLSTETLTLSYRQNGLILSNSKNYSSLVPVNLHNASSW